MSESVQEKLWQAQPVPEEIKREVAACLLDDEKPVDLAKKYNISLATISRIKHKYLSKDMIDKMESEKAAVLGDLLIMKMESGIEANVRIANLTADKAWITSQNAGDLGKMYGIISDKVIRVAEAMDNLKPSAVPQDLEGGTTGEDLLN